MLDTIYTRAADMTTEELISNLSFGVAELGDRNNKEIEPDWLVALADEVRSRFASDPEVRALAGAVASMVRDSARSYWSENRYKKIVADADQIVGQLMEAVG